MNIGIYALDGAQYVLGEEPGEIVARISKPEGEERFRMSTTSSLLERKAYWCRRTTREAPISLHMSRKIGRTKASAAALRLVDGRPERMIFSRGQWLQDDAAQQFRSYFYG